MELYANIQKVGEGGFGEVYKATNKQTGEKCALKRIKQIDQSALDEVEALQQVKGHPNIVNIQSYFIARGSLWVVTGFCEGGELNSYFWDKKPDVNVKFRFMQQMASAVSFLHNKGIAHRDLKPENILIGFDANQQPEVKLTDFGIAKIHCGEQMTRQFMTTCAGTAFFLAPEVLSSLQGGKYTVKADVFSLGVIFRAMVFDIGLPCGENRKYLVACFIADGNPIPYCDGMLHDKTLQVRVEESEIASATARQLMNGMLLRDASKRLSSKEVDKAMISMTPDHFRRADASGSSRPGAASASSEAAGNQAGGQLFNRLTETIRAVKPSPQQEQEAAAKALCDGLFSQFTQDELGVLKQKILVLFVTLSRNAPPAAKLTIQQAVMPVLKGIDRVQHGESLVGSDAARFAIGWLKFQEILKQIKQN